MWTWLDDVEDGVVPDDLAAALGDLRGVWDGWPRSVTRGTLEWIKQARTAPTRAKRIEDVRASAAAGLRPSVFRR
nr:YdeI/OmpD-associated family protein [Jannaschia sp. Os4]